MKQVYLRLAGTLALSCGIAACVPAPPEPAPAPAQAPSPKPAPAPPPAAVAQAPEYENWLDAPHTPGDWSYVDEPAESLALFGDSNPGHLFIMRCDKASRTVGIARSGESSTPLMMRIRTETTDRALNAANVPGRPFVAANLAPRDPLLDAMAVTKGRVAIEVEGMPALYVPAWPEISRVIEDCR